MLHSGKMQQKHRNLKWLTTSNPHQMQYMSCHSLLTLLFFCIFNISFSIYPSNKASPFHAKCCICFGNTLLSKTEFLTFESSLSNVGKNFNIMIWMLFQGWERTWPRWIYALGKVPSKWEIKCGLGLTKDRG